MILAAATSTSGIYGILFHVPETSSLVNTVYVYLVKGVFLHQAPADHVLDFGKEFLVMNDAGDDSTTRRSPMVVGI